MHKRTFISVFVFITSLVFFTSCSNDEAFHQNQISVLKTQLKTLTNETKRILKSLEVKQQVTPQMIPYNAIAKRQSAVLANYIDTNLNGNYTDTAALTQKLNKLKTEYFNVLDSSIKAFGHPMFLTQDYEHLKSMKFNLLTISKTDFTLNYYFTMQNIIMQHKEDLRNIFSYVGTFCGFYRYDFNSSISVYENDKITSIKICCSAPKNMAKLQAVKGVTLFDSNDKNIPFTTNGLQNDTLFITTQKLKPGNYRALINVNITYTSGDEHVRELYIPFSAH